MTPTSSGKRSSGNPATQAKIELSVKQQREQQKQEKLAEYQRQLAKRRRSRLTWWVVGVTAGLAVVALIAASVIFAPKKVTYEAGGTGAEIEGVDAQAVQQVAAQVLDPAGAAALADRIEQG